VRSGGARLDFRGVQSLATERLLLRAPEYGDLDDLFELYADEQVWRDDPMSRQTTRAQTADMIDRWRSGWSRDGLGMWVARDPATRSLVGVGGAFVRYDVAWNLGYRLRHDYWGQGFAQEISRAAFDASSELRPDLPMTAYLVEGNVRSQRATERTGLHLVWRGPDVGNPNPRAIRLLYSDRQLAASIVRVLIED
jgi:RimJ/RimL family protein N-acetyltransferase